MKILFLRCIVLQLALVSTFMYAQDRSPVEPLRLGLATAVKASINTSAIPTGWKTGICMEGFPDISFSASIPLKNSISLSALVDLGVSSNSFLVKPFPNPTDSSITVLRSRYLSIAPAIALPYGFLGLNIGVPVYAARISNDGSTNEQSVLSGGSSKNLVNLMALNLEIRLGGTLPLIEDTYGLLSAYGVVSYQLSSSFTSFSTMSPILYNATKTTDSNDPRSISLSLGLRYLFDIGSAASNP